MCEHPAIDLPLAPWHVVLRRLTLYTGYVTCPWVLHNPFYGGGDVVVKRILLTGMSGTGKSTVIGELAARGYKAVDADCDEFSEWVEVIGDSGTLESPVEVDRDWVWREDRIQDLLSTEDTDVLFLSGCAENMRKFLPQFDHIVLLSAPADVIVERLGSRTNNPYGKHPEEVARVLGLVERVEPLLRRAAGHEIDTSARLEDVVATLLRLVRSQSSAAGGRGVTCPTTEPGAS